MKHNVIYFNLTCKRQVFRNALILAILLTLFHRLHYVYDQQNVFQRTFPPLASTWIETKYNSTATVTLSNNVHEEDHMDFVAPKSSHISPTSLKQQRVVWLKEIQEAEASFVDERLPTDDPTFSYWELLQRHVFQEDQAHRWTAQDIICSVGPGQGMEEDAGYKLLVDKIRIAERNYGPSRPKLFCGIYPYSGRQVQAQVQALSWGWKCDGFLVFSNHSLPSFGITNLPHAGPEAYGNMWQKLRSLWQSIYDSDWWHEYDYFHVGGDDMYVLVDNLRHLLDEIQQTHNSAKHSSSTPLWFGQWLPEKSMLVGGPGYTLNQAALKLLVEQGLPKCHPNSVASYEDRILGNCFGAVLGITGNATDTRDFVTGAQRYHDANPASLYTFRVHPNSRSYQSKMAASWEGLPHPNPHSKMPIVGPRHGLEAASQYSVSLHNIHSAIFVMRLTALLYPQTCPPNSPLGIGLRHHWSFLNSLHS